MKRAEKENLLKFGILLFALFSISLVSSISCTPAYVSTSYVSGTGYSTDLSCTNSLNSSVSIIKTGSYYTLDKTSLNPSSTESIHVTLQSDAPVGTHTGEISFNDSSQIIPVLFSVSSSTSTSGILVFPTSKVVSVKQGEEKTQNILVTIPSTYPESITIQSVDFNPGTETIRFSDLNLGLISPGSTIQIPIVFSGVDASIGTYQTNLNIFAINSSGQIPLPSINLQLQVVQGISPLTNFSTSDLPSCSLSATELNMNQTYSLTCTKNNPNVHVSPMIDDFYLTGTDVQDSSSQYVYKFRAKNLGNTVFKANFLFYGASVGEPFSQELRISPSGSSPVPGTVLDFIFYQNSQNTPMSEITAGNLTILVVDNSTRNSVSTYSLLLDGVAVNNTVVLVANKNYEVRASSAGYLDKVINFTAKESSLEIYLEPAKDSYIVGEMINITSNTDGVSYLLNDAIITSPHTFLSPGTFVLKAEKQGYISKSMNITVEGSQLYKTLSKPPSEWKKKDVISVELNGDMSWIVEFSKKTKDGFEAPVIISSNTSSSANFTIEDYGVYAVKGINGESIFAYTFVKKAGFKEWYNSHAGLFYFLIVIPIVGFSSFLIIKNRKKKSPELLFGGPKTSVGIEEGE